MSVECMSLLKHTGLLLSSAEGGQVARDLVARGAGLDEIVDAFVRLSDDEQQSQLLRLEMAELPPIVVSTILDAWVMAETAGKELRLESVPPSRPLEFARSRRVAVAVALDETGVTVSLSHVPGRHAEWYGGSRQVA